MTLTYGFYDSSSSDRVYNAKQFGSIFDGIIEDGVYAGIGGKLMVIENSPTGMSVIVQSGRAWFDHTWTLNDANLVKTIAAADALLNRIDVVYLEVNEDSGTRANSINVLTGTPASTPVAPTLTNTSVIHQYPLAHVYIGAAVTVITQANITNKVGTTSTPFVAGIIDYVTTNEIVAQWEAEWDQWFQDIIDQLSTEAETNLQNQIWDLAGVASGAPPYADDMVNLANHDHTGTHPKIPRAGIVDYAIGATQLDANAVTTSKINNSAVTESKIGTGAVTQTKIGNLAVGSSQIANNAIISSKYGIGSIDNGAILADNVVDSEKVGNRVAQVYRRKGGSSTNWQTPGTSTYDPGPVRIQAGSHSWTGNNSSGTFTVTFPQAYSYGALAFAQNYNDIDVVCHQIVSAPPTDAATFYWWSTSGANKTALTFFWLAIGPE